LVETAAQHFQELCAIEFGLATGPFAYSRKGLGEVSNKKSIHKTNAFDLVNLFMLCLPYADSPLTGLFVCCLSV
jgi:hypothetical protein